MVVKKSAKPAKKKPRRPATWQDAIRQHLSKAPWVDAVYAHEPGGTVHVYSYVKELGDKYYEGILEQERVVEELFPAISFEFHTWAHQGRDLKTLRLGCELVYLR